MSFPTAAELDLDDIEVPEGLALAVYPPAMEYMKDPKWWDQGGRDVMDQWKILKMQAGPERTQKLQKLIEEYPRYGPKMYEKCAKADRADIIRELLSLGASMDIELAKRPRDDLPEDEEDEDIPTAEMEPAIITAAFDGHLECIKVLVEEGYFDINTQLDGFGASVLGITAVNGYTEIVEWLLDHGAVITFEREGSIDDINGSIKSGKVDVLSRILADQQTTTRNFKLTPPHLRYAAWSGKSKMVKFVLEHAGFPSMLLSADSGDTHVDLPVLSPEQKKALVESLHLATASRSVESLRLMLSYLTPRRADGSFEYFALDNGNDARVFNATEDAMEEATDVPELFELAWETLLCPPQEELDASEQAREHRDDWLNRRLISACAEGCPETVKLICEKYGGNINHISHKLSSTPLGRAAGSGRNSLPPRLAIAKYLLNQPGIDIDLANGEYSNGITALGLAIQNGQSQVEMIKLLLKHGGPVELVEETLVEQAKALEPAEKMSLIAVVSPFESRCPVKLVTKETWEVMQDGPAKDKVVLELDGREAPQFFDNLRDRKSDAALAEDDPKNRPLD